MTYTYNILNRPETVKTGTTIAATYHWLADGTKYRVADASGNGVIYAGALTYAVSGNGTTYALESADGSTDGTARFLKNSASMAAYYTIRDHLGSVRTVTDRWGSVAERNDYYPFGQRTTFGSEYPRLAANRQKFSGKEDQSALGTVALPYLDFGARMYDPKLVRWNTYDPLAEKTYGINPYVYCANDPVSCIDPDGRDIWEINNRGKVVNHIGDRTQDAFYMVDKNGNRTYTTDIDGNKHYNSISFEYGTITDSKKSGWFRSATSFAVNSESSGAELFKFFADNTKIEYGLINTQSNGSTVMTNHNESSVGRVNKQVQRLPGRCSARWR